MNQKVIMHMNVCCQLQQPQFQQLDQFQTGLGMIRGLDRGRGSVCPEPLSQYKFSKTAL